MELQETFGPPLDYSWHELKSVDEVLEDEPSGGMVKGDGRLKEMRLPKGVQLKANSNSLKLSNNELTTLDGLDQVSERIFDDIRELQWLDASYNNIEEISDSLLAFPNLKVLYLHGNAISNLREVKKLSALEKLQRLTLHGNQIEEHPRYRLSVLDAVPQLSCHDFVPRTKLDRDVLKSWCATP